MRTNQTQKALRGRRGISLLEVLITMGVLTIGLLGLAMLIPLGHYHNTQAENADRSAACGRMAFRELEARDMLRPEHWVWRKTNAAWPNTLPPLPTGSPARPYPTVTQNNYYVRTFMIDPLVVAANWGNTSDRSRLFPATGAQRMRRCSLDYLLYGRPNPVNQPRLTRNEAFSAADQLFTCRDDVALAPPANDEKGRPLMLATAPQTTIHGDYSWMAMVSPSEAENGQMPLGQRRLYNVAVIVSYKRVLNLQGGSLPSEQQVQVTTVIGPRAVQLDNVNIHITPGQWIMLSGELRPPVNQLNLRRWLYRWYRVVSVGRDEANPRRYQLNLAGPDWDSSPAHLVGPTYATIVDKVVGVFERTVELDVRSLMSL